jgi:hypothetical protein
MRLFASLDKLHAPREEGGAVVIEVGSGDYEFGPGRTGTAQEQAGV